MIELMDRLEIGVGKALMDGTWMEWNAVVLDDVCT
jgi:hypothetical protein